MKDFTEDDACSLSDELKISVILMRSPSVIVDKHNQMNACMTRLKGREPLDVIREAVSRMKESKDKKKHYIGLYKYNDEWVRYGAIQL